MKRIIAVNSNCYHGYGVAAAISGTRAAGFRNIELTATKGWTEHVFPTLSLRELWGVKDLLAASGVTAVALSGHTNLTDRARRDDFIANIRLAAFFNCRYIVSSIGEAHLADNSEASDEATAEAVAGLLPILEEQGLILALENHGAHATGSCVAGIVRMIGSESVRVNYDSGNALFYGGADVIADLRESVDVVGFMHLKDKAGAVGEWNFPALGQGYVDFPQLIAVLDEAGNDCPLAIEIEFTAEGSHDEGEVNEALAASHSYLASLGMEGLLL